MEPTPVFETYWRFASERQAMYLRRLGTEGEPWTLDPILSAYRFTNVYRASDRVSQYLIREIQYGEGRSQAPKELFFRTLLFKVFNRIETWEALERKLGPVTYGPDTLNGIAHVLDRLMAGGQRVYSAAYIMPCPRLGHARKHTNHLALIRNMIEDRLVEGIQRAANLSTIYKSLLAYPGLGPFLAFQYTIDLNYSTLLDHEEADFVMAGPGALDGIAKCFSHTGKLDAEEVIHWVCDRQERAIADAGLDFQNLFGRRLQPIDCQNLFCEISKYARVAHPSVKGVSGRTRIKQAYRRSPRPLPFPQFPPRWGLDVASHICKLEADGQPLKRVVSYA